MQKRLIRFHQNRFDVASCDKEAPRAGGLGEGSDENSEHVPAYLSRAAQVLRHISLAVNTFQFRLRDQISFRVAEVVDLAYYSLIYFWRRLNTLYTIRTARNASLVDTLDAGSGMFAHTHVIGHGPRTAQRITP